MGKRKQIFYLISFLFFIKVLFASTTNNTQIINNNQDIAQFSADNSTEGVKNSKPVNLSVDQDSLLGWIADAKGLFGINPANATAVELAAGPKVFRANGTYGYALNDKNRIKLTGEYLRENLEFDYFTGDTRQWVGQGAVGAAYEYWLDGGIFKSLQLGSYYSHAGSKNLSDKTLYLDNTTLLDQRRIAGANDWNGTAETAMRLWPHSLVVLGADYDNVRYDTQYEIQDEGTGDAQGFGGHIRLQQLLTASTQLQLQSLVSQLTNTYGGGLNWIWTSHKTTAWAAGFNSTYTDDHTTDRRFWTNGINISIVWDQPRENKDAVARFSDPDVSAENLLTWTATPAVRMPDVLAISDERITTVAHNIPFQSVTATCPANGSLVYNSSSSSFSAPGGWVQSYPLGGVSNFQPAFRSANIMNDATRGPVACLYTIGPVQELILTNTSYQLVQADGNNWIPGAPAFWPLSQQPAVNCSSSSPDNCQFSTVDPSSVKSTVMQKNTQALNASEMNYTRLKL